MSLYEVKYDRGSELLETDHFQTRLLLQQFAPPYIRNWGSVQAMSNGFKAIRFDLNQNETKKTVQRQGRSCPSWQGSGAATYVQSKTLKPLKWTSMASPIRRATSQKHRVPFPKLFFWSPSTGEFRGVSDVPTSPLQCGMRTP